MFDAFVPAIDLRHVSDDALVCGAQAGKQERHAGPDIGAFERLAAQARWANHHRPVWVAQDDAPSHGDQFVYEEEPALEHFFVNQHGAARLRGHYQHDAHQVGGKAGPGRIIDFRDGIVYIHDHFQRLRRGHEDVIAAYLHVHPKPRNFSKIMRK